MLRLSWLSALQFPVSPRPAHGSRFRAAGLALAGTAALTACDISPLSPITFDTTTSTGALSGIWCDADGHAIGDVVVVDDSGVEVARAVTGSDGSFAVSGLVSGHYNVVPAAAFDSVDVDADAGTADGGLAVVAAAEAIGVDIRAGEITTLWDDSCGVACEVGTEVNAEDVGAEVDILIVVDSSRSMSDDNAAVASALNTFSQRVALAGFDARVVLIGKTTVPPPLSTSARYRHIDTDVPSAEPLVRLLATRTQWQSFVRTTSKKEIVVITDDDSALSATAFMDGLRDGAGFDDVTVHAVYAYGEDHDRGCSSGAAWGSVYEALVTETGGTRAPVCSASYDDVFDGLASAVTAPQLPCALSVPTLPVNTVVTGATITWLRHSDAGDVVYDVDLGATCGSGWAFLSDTTVAACADACAALDDVDADDSLSAVFSCGF